MLQESLLRSAKIFPNNVYSPTGGVLLENKQFAQVEQQH